MIPLTTDCRMLGFASLQAYPNISHFVTTRLGGVSMGSYASFNCSPFTGDNPEHIRANTERLLDALSVKPRWLLAPHQVHGVSVLNVTSEVLEQSEEVRRSLLDGVDALITDVRGCCIMISTADCVPVLFYVPGTEVIAVAHAGWRGTVRRIAVRVVERMMAIYDVSPDSIRVCIGPSISQTAFEVGDEVYATFKNAGFEMDSLACRNVFTQKWHIDLWKANIQQLLAVGLSDSHIECAGLCTYQHSDLFFSARKLGIDSGRIMTGIMLNL